MVLIFSFNSWQESKSVHFLKCQTVNIVNCLNQLCAANPFAAMLGATMFM